MIEPSFYRRVEASRLLAQAPVLASWDAAGHPAQQRLADYLADATGELASAASTSSGPVALRLEVGLPDEADLLHERDLDNYLFPLAHHLTRHGGVHDLVSATAVKRHAKQSFIGLGRAVPVTPPLRTVVAIRTTASAESAAYKEQVRSQVDHLAELPPGPVQLDIGFVVGPTRSWLNLWKPTIDALDPLLGPTTARAWNPQDGRITELGLHCRVDPRIGHDVAIFLSAGPAADAERRARDQR